MASGSAQTFQMSLLQIFASFCRIAWFRLETRFNFETRKDYFKNKIIPNVFTNILTKFLRLLFINIRNCDLQYCQNAVLKKFKLSTEFS